MVNPEMINDLWLQIDTLHLSYLHTEESPQRIEQKKKLKGYMKEYLSSVTCNQRFYSPTTKAILYSSLLKHGDQLSPTRFRHAWEMLATYAANLLGHPWRKEFNEIRLYSGAFKYQIEQQLVGAEEMLMEMGYTLDIEYNRLMIQGLIDYDQVVIIHRDCLLAEVESQILCEIHSALSTSPRPCTWVSIFDFRDSYVGTVNHCVRGLMYQNAQKDSLMSYGYTNTAPTTYLGPHEIYPNPIPYQMMYQQCVKPTYPHTTDQRETYLPKTLPMEDYAAKCYSAKPIESRNVERLSHPQETFDVWNNSLAREMKSIPKFDSLLDIDRLEQLCYEDVVDSCPKISVVDRQKENKTQPPRDEKSSHSSFDRLVEKNVLRSSNKLSSIPSNTGSKPKEMVGNVTKSANERTTSAKFNGWECLFCTFLNLDDREICDMCSKSRHRGPESQPLHRGGRECSHCTLVNPPDEQNCAACSTSLTHAPTYI